MKDLFVNFIYNLKMYLKYIVKVGFKELAIDVLILLAIVVISAFAYIPVGLIEELVREFLNTFVSFSGSFGGIYIFVFNMIKAIAAVMLFIYLFNIRYDFKNEKVVPVEGSYTLKRNDDIQKKETKVKKNSEEIDLPKEKEEK